MRHVISRPLAIFVLLLILTAVLPQLAVRLSDSAAPLPAAYFAEGEASPDAAKLCSFFGDLEMVSYESRAELESDLEKGRLSIGVVVPADFSQRLAEGDSDEILILLEGRSSVFEALEKTEISSALFKVIAPYITKDSLENSGFTVDDEAVFETYYSMIDSGSLFTFEQQTVEGTSVEPVSRLNLFRLALGLLLWLTVLLGICVPLTARVNSIAPAIGKEKAWKCLGIPAFIFAFSVLFAAGAASCIIAGYNTLILPVLLTAALMGLAGLVLCLVFPGGHICTLVCVFLAAFAPALCPGLTDISLVVPVIEKIRVICPVYWLWLL